MNIEDYVLKASKELAVALLKEIRARPGTEVIESPFLPSVFHERAGNGYVETRPHKIAMIMEIQLAKVDDKIHATKINTSVEPRW